jgi:hypothetical protein
VIVTLVPPPGSARHAEDPVPSFKDGIGRGLPYNHGVGLPTKIPIWVLHPRTDARLGVASVW